MIYFSVDLEKDWKNKEIAYIQEIQDLRVAASKTASDKIEEMKQDVSKIVYFQFFEAFCRYNSDSSEKIVNVKWITMGKQTYSSSLFFI